MDSATDNLNATPPVSAMTPESDRETPRVPLSPDHPHVNRTERGLVVRGTRLTLYQLWEHIEKCQPAEEAREFYKLSREVMDDVLGFIADNRTLFDAEYQKVLRDAEALRLYYEERNRPMLEKIAAMPPPPGKEAQFAMLQERKRRLGMK